MSATHVHGVPIFGPVPNLEEIVHLQTSEKPAFGPVPPDESGKKVELRTVYNINHVIVNSSNSALGPLSLGRLFISFCQK